MMKKILILASVVALALPLSLAGCKGRAEQQAEIQRLQTELTNAKAAANAASDKAKKEREMLTAEMNTVTQARDKLQERISKLDELALARDQLQQQVAELTGSRDTLQEKLTDGTRERATLQQQVETLTTSRDTALAEAQRTQAKIKELTTKLQAETAKVGEVQKQLQSVAASIEERVEAPAIKTIESPIIRSFTTTRPRVSPGQKSTLSWWVTDADRVRIEPNIGSVGALGSRTIAPTKTTTYTLIATNEAGESRVTRRIEVL